MFGSSWCLKLTTLTSLDSSLHFHCLALVALLHRWILRQLQGRDWCLQLLVKAVLVTWLHLCGQKDTKFRLRLVKTIWVTWQQLQRKVSVIFVRATNQDHGPGSPTQAMLCGNLSFVPLPALILSVPSNERLDPSMFNRIRFPGRSKVWSDHSGRALLQGRSCSIKRAMASNQTYGKSFAQVQLCAARIRKNTRK